jgi:hypothetical protein
MPKKYTIAAHATIVLSTIKERPFQALFLAANFINFTTQKIQSLHLVYNCRLKPKTHFFFSFVAVVKQPEENALIKPRILLYTYDKNNPASIL